MHSSLNTSLESTTDHGIDSSQYQVTEMFAISLVNVRFLTALAVIALNISDGKLKNIHKTSAINQAGVNMVPTMST